VVHRLCIVVVLQVLVPLVLAQDILPLVNKQMHYKQNSAAGQQVNHKLRLQVLVG